MVKLTTEQKREIDRHKVPLSKVFDATDLSRQQAIRAMSDGKEIVMVNGLECRNDPSHVLRTRYGHCVECNPAGIAIQARKSTEGYTYLAGSEGAGLLKIGMAIDPQRRKGMLNSLRYGGASDWELLVVVKTDKAGLIEYEAQRMVAAYQVDGSYYKDGRAQGCYELFRCTYDIALSAIKRAISVYGGEVVKQTKGNGRYGTTPQHARNAAVMAPEPHAVQLLPAENIDDAPDASVIIPPSKSEFSLFGIKIEWIVLSMGVLFTLALAQITTTGLAIYWALWIGVPLLLAIWTMRYHANARKRLSD